MTITGLRDYRQAAQDDHANWLGQVVIFTVADTRVKYDDLVDRLRHANLDTYLPPAPKDVNVFLRTFTDGVRRTIKVPTADDPDRAERVMMRTLDRKGGRVVKRLVIETAEVAEEELRYVEVLEATFDKDNPHLVGIRPVPGGYNHPAAWEIARSCEVDYYRERGCVDGNAIRTFMRAVFEACHATSLRTTGGAYFVKQEYSEKAEALADVAELIPGASVLTIPLVDSEKQRANIKRAFETESMIELDRLLLDMRGLLKAKEPVSYAVIKQFSEQSLRAKSRVRTYTDLLKDAMDGVNTKIDIFDSMLGQLLMLQKVD